MISTLIQIAISFWLSFGSIPVPPIDYTNEIADFPKPYENIVAWTEAPINTGQACKIHLMPLFYTTSMHLAQLIIDHEVGHCFGLQHIAEPGIMHLGTSEETVSTWADRVEFERVYYPHKVVVPMVSN